MAEVPMRDYSKLPGNPKEGKGAEEKPEKPKLEKVVTGDVTIKPPGFGSRVRSMFFGEDFRNVVRYVTAEVLLPAARNLIVDMTTRGVERAVYGEAPRRSRPPQYQSHVSYQTPVTRGYSTPPRSAALPDQPPHYPPARQSSSRLQGDLILGSREEAELVVERMMDVLRQFEVVSVADLYELIDQPIKHTDQKWGWYYLGNVQVRQVREGYLIDLPPAEAI